MCKRVMLRKIYPADQMEKYLLIDVIIILFLIYRVLTEGSVHFIEGILYIVLFLAAYYVCLWHHDWRLLISSTIGFLLLAVIGVKVGSWILLYGFVFAHLLGRSERKVQMGIGMTGIALMFFLYCWIVEGSPIAIFHSYYFPVMLAQLVTPAIVYFRLKTDLLEEKLDIANEQLERYIQEEERNRIARDLHDTLGQTLTMIKLKSELALRLVEKSPDKAKHEMNDILKSAMHALRQAGELVTDMKYISLNQELEHSKDVLQKAGIAFHGTFKQSKSSLTHEAETMLALSVREAVTNIIKHSDASSCTIAQYEQDGYYIIVVSDNGNGGLKQGEGNGLQYMKERMTMLQGKVFMQSKPNDGTVITLQVPLIRNGREE